MKRTLLPSQQRTLNTSEEDTTLDFNLALSVAKYFSLSKVRAEEILNEIKSSVSNWQKTATKYGIPRSEQDLMSGAFKNFPDKKDQFL